MSYTSKWGKILYRFGPKTVSPISPLRSPCPSRSWCRGRCLWSCDLSTMSTSVLCRWHLTCRGCGLQGACGRGGCGFPLLQSWHYAWTGFGRRDLPWYSYIYKKQIKYCQLQSYRFISIYPRKDFYFFQTLKFFNRKDRGRESSGTGSSTLKSEPMYLSPWPKVIILSTTDLTEF